MSADRASNMENRGADGSRRVPIYINRNFALLWSGGAVSILGDFVFNTTLVLWIATSIAKGQPWAPLAVGGALLAAIFAQRIGLVRTFCFALIATGVGVLVYARLTSYPPALAVSFGIGLCAAPIDIAFVPIMLHVTPPQFVGRVMAVFSPSIQAASVLSIALAGYLDSAVLRGFHASILGLSIGPVDTIFTACGLLAIIGGVYTAVNLRGIKIGNTPSSAASADTVDTINLANAADTALIPVTVGIPNTPTSVRASPMEPGEG